LNVLEKAYLEITKSLKASKRKTDKIRKPLETKKHFEGLTSKGETLIQPFDVLTDLEGGLLEVETREVCLETKADWEALDLIHETMIKALNGQVSPWAFETPANMVRYLRGAVRKRLIQIKQDLIEAPVSLWEAPEALEAPDLENEVSIFKTDLFNYIRGATRKNGKALLSEKEKGLFETYYKEGLTLKELAEKAGASIQTVGKDVSRLNKKIGALPLKDYFNAPFVSPSGAYFPRHKADLSNLIITNLAPLKRFRITKAPEDLEAHRRASLEALKAHRKEGAGFLRAVSPSDYKAPAPWVSPYTMKEGEAKRLWALWVSSPAFGVWYETGRNGGQALEYTKPLIVEKRDKHLAFKPLTLWERIMFRMKETTRPLSFDLKPFTKRDKIIRLITKAYNRGNYPYVKTLKTYLETLPPVSYRGKAPAPCGKLVEVKKRPAL
jgi:DNA-directed RNA polymerase specialized sigma24 family protein